MDTPTLESQIKDLMAAIRATIDAGDDPAKKDEARSMREAALLRVREGR